MEKYKIVEIIAFNVDETVQKHPKMLWPEDQKESGPAICWVRGNKATFVWAVPIVTSFHVC